MNGYVPAIDEVFPREAEAIEDAAARATERAQRERATLTRPDGSPVYGPAEQQEREAAIFEGAATEYDRATACYVEQAERERRKAEADLARLDGFDPWERLSEAERQAAATRREFIREDAERLLPADVERRARAALAANDKAAVYLWARYLRPRVGAGAGRELGGVVRDLEAVFGDLSERHRQRLALERRIEATKSLRGRVEDGRGRADGTRER